MEKTTETYEQKVVSQTELVKKLAEAQKAAPSDEKKYKLQQEIEILRHYSNAVKENPKERSQTAYKFAHNAVLDSVIEQKPE